MHLPLLQTQLRNLSIRQTSLEANLLKRTGATLDKMIDQAARLKGLGGTDGPREALMDAGEGAVPERLLDIQDELELRVGEIKDDLVWGRELASRKER